MRNNQKQYGFVLVAVLFVIVLMISLILGVNLQSRLQARQTTDFTSAQQSLFTARAGLNVAMSAIKQANDSFAEMLNHPMTITLGKHKCEILIVDENSKININKLISGQGKMDRNRVDQCLKLIDILNRDSQSEEMFKYSLIASIIDWVDGDDQVTFFDFVTHHNRGAESDYYQSLDQPYNCANQPMSLIDELQYVKEASFLSEGNRILDQYLTVHGDGLININTASKEVLESLSEKMTPALVQMIIELRNQRPFGHIQELRDLPSLDNNAFNQFSHMITVQPEDNVYKIKTSTDVNGIEKIITTVVEKKPQADVIKMVYYKES